MNYSKPISEILKYRYNSNGGSFASYYRISKRRGIKLLYGEYESVERILKSRAYTSAVKESEILKKLTKRGSDFTPKSYGVKIIKRGKKFRVGILMQHLGSKTLGDRYTVNYSEYQITKMLRKKLSALGAYHRDIHDRNIMWHKKKYYLIDFTPTFIRFKK